MKQVVITTVIVFMLIGGIGFLRLLADKRQSPSIVKNEIIPVRVQQALRTGIEQKLEYVGNVRAQEEVYVYPKVTGKIIAKMKSEGDPVIKTETLLHIDRDEVGLKFEKAPVESPLDGVIGALLVDLGEHVTPQTPVALILKMDHVKITLDLPEVYLSKIFLQQDVVVSFDAYPGEVFQGRITKISPLLHLANRAFPVEILIANPEQKLISGMFAKVDLIIEAHPEAITLRKEAILGKEPHAYAYVITDNQAKLHKVTLGIQSGDRIEILDGIKEHDSVVILGHQRLFEGARVKPEPDLLEER